MRIFLLGLCSAIVEISSKYKRFCTGNLMCIHSLVYQQFEQTYSVCVDDGLHQDELLHRVRFWTWEGRHFRGLFNKVTLYSSRVRFGDCSKEQNIWVLVLACCFRKFVENKC